MSNNRQFKRNNIGRECSACNKFKIWKHFYFGKSICKKCASNYDHDRRQKTEILKKQPKFVSNMQGNMQLKFLIGLRKPSKKEWTYEQIRTLAHTLRTEVSKGNFDFKEIYKNCLPDKSYQACNSMKNELTRAAENNMTILGYWNAGRPFSQKAKNEQIVVPGEKEIKKKKNA